MHHESCAFCSMMPVHRGGIFMFYTAHDALLLIILLPRCVRLASVMTNLAYSLIHPAPARMCMSPTCCNLLCRFGDLEQNIIKDNREIGATFKGSKINVH